MNENAVTIPKSIPWIYFVYSITNSFGTIVTQTYLNYFMTNYAGVNQTVLASVLTVARLIDLAVSLVSGAIVQKTNTKAGAFRPWVFGCSIVTWIGCIVTFVNPDIALNSKLAVVLVGYCMTHLPMNFLTVSQNGLMVKMSGANPNDRMAITVKRTQGMNAARIITSMLTLPIINIFAARQMNGYLMTIILFGIVCIVGAFAMFKVSKQYDTYNPDLKNVAGSTANVKLSTIYKESLSNAQTWVLLLGDIMKMVAAQAIASFGPYYFRYSAGNLDYMTLSGTVAGFVALGASIIAPPVAKKLGKKNSHILSSVLAAASYACLGFFTDKNPVLYIVFLSLGSVGLSFITTYGVNLYLDTAEYQLFKTGRDNRPFIMSLQNIPIKLGFMASSPILAFVLNRTGYVAGDNGYVENTKLMVMFIGLIPMVLYGLTALLMAFGYKITDEKAREYASANQKSMAERTAKAKEGAKA